MNNNTHPCANKCSEYKAEQCMNCLINETEVRGVYSMHRINLWQDDTPMGTRTVDISMGDDEHIENHISPLCKTESQPVLIVESDNQIIERLKAENKMLHEAAAKHLRNQNHFKDLYDALVEQLYPYAIDLKEPVTAHQNLQPQQFVDGYNRALKCVHYNLMEMMESDVEYIRAQCGMLGGGGEA